jgi:hypothetical protein
MSYEYLDDIAEELGVEGEELQEVAHHLGIRTLETAVPPYGADLSTAVSRQDAMQLRDYYGTGPVRPQ